MRARNANQNQIDVLVFGSFNIPLISVLSIICLTVGMEAPFKLINGCHRRRSESFHYYLEEISFRRRWWTLITIIMERREYTFRFIFVLIVILLTVVAHSRFDHQSNGTLSVRRSMWIDKWKFYSTGMADICTYVHILLVERETEQQRAVSHVHRYN